MQLETNSPNGRHKAVFEIAGQIRFGPPYYNLKIDEWDFGERVFGDVCLWSSDSTLFAVQEWLSTSYQAGPRTALTLFDLASREECRLSRAESGFIVPLSFEGNLLIYKKRYLGRGIIKEFEIDFRSLDRWEKIKKV